MDQGISFPVYLSKIFGDFPGYICNTEECDSIVTAENCEDNPELAFLLISVRNFYVWQKSVLKAMANQHDRIQDYLPGMVQNYTVHDLSDSV